MLVPQHDPGAKFDLQLLHGGFLGAGEVLHLGDGVGDIVLPGLRQHVLDLADAVFGDADGGVGPLVQIAGVFEDGVLPVDADIFQHGADCCFDLGAVKGFGVLAAFQICRHGWGASGYRQGFNVTVVLRDRVHFVHGRPEHGQTYGTQRRFNSARSS